MVLGRVLLKAKAEVKVKEKVNQKVAHLTGRDTQPLAKAKARKAKAGRDLFAKIGLRLKAIAPVAINVLSGTLPLAPSSRRAAVPREKTAYSSTQISLLVQGCQDIQLLRRTLLLLKLIKLSSIKIRN